MRSLLVRAFSLRFRSANACFFAAWLLSNSANAAAPVLDHLFPAAVQVGTTNVVTAVGKFDAWPAKVWVDAPGIVFKAETNSGKFSVEVAADAPVGGHLVRLYNDQGVSGLRFIVVTKERQTEEVEPNNEFKKPQAIEAFPAFINGRLEKSGDVDSYAVALEVGQTLVASVEAYTLASPVDAVLRVVDARGVQVAWNHDGGPTLDPFLTWTAKSAGTYVVQVFGFGYPADSSVNFVGNTKCVYRLHLSRGPYVNHTVPLGVTRGKKTTVELVGWNLPAPASVEFDATAVPDDRSEARLVGKGFSNEVQLAVVDGEVVLEREPNDTASGTNRITLPCGVTGRIDRAGDVDRFPFTARKDAKWLISVEAVALGFPLDAWVRIEDAQGKELAKNDGATGVDPKLEWTVPADGEFVVVVGNRLQRGGADFRYHLLVRPAKPELRVTLTDSALAVTPGQTNDFKVALKRLHGFAGELKVAATNLPPGLSVEPVVVASKDNEAVLKFVASTNAQPWSGPLQISATETNGRLHRAVFDLTSATVNNGVPGGYQRLVVESTDQLWLTLLPAPKPKSDEKKK